MIAMLRDHPSGGYWYMPGISAFSCGTVAMRGHEIVHVTLAAPVPWRDGFARPIGEHTRLAEEEARAHFDDQIATILDPDGYGVWFVPVLSAAVPDTGRSMR